MRVPVMLTSSNGAVGAAAAVVAVDSDAAGTSAPSAASAVAVIARLSPSAEVPATAALTMSATTHCTFFTSPPECFAGNHVLEQPVPRHPSASGRHVAMHHDAPFCSCLSRAMV